MVVTWHPLADDRNANAFRVRCPVLVSSLVISIYRVQLISVLSTTPSSKYFLARRSFSCRSWACFHVLAAHTHTFRARKCNSMTGTFRSCLMMSSVVQVACPMDDDNDEYGAAHSVPDGLALTEVSPECATATVCAQLRCVEGTHRRIGAISRQIRCLHRALRAPRSLFHRFSFSGEHRRPNRWFVIWILKRI